MKNVLVLALALCSLSAFSQTLTVTKRGNLVLFIHSGQETVNVSPNEFFDCFMNTNDTTKIIISHAKMNGSPIWSKTSIISIDGVLTTGLGSGEIAFMIKNLVGSLNASVASSGGGGGSATILASDSVKYRGSMRVSNPITGFATETTLGSLNTKLPTGLTVTANRLQVELPIGGTGLTNTEIRATALPISGTVSANATLSAETVKVIGTVNISSGQTVGVTGSFFQATQPVSLASTTITGSVAVTGGLTDTQLRTTALPISGTVTANATLSSETTKVIGTVNVAGTVPVTGTFFQTTQPVSASSLPLPAGAATSANQQTNALTDAQIRLTPLPVSGTVVTGGLTDTQIRATALPVSGAFFQATQPISGTVNTGLTQPLTDAQIRATSLPVTTQSGGFVSALNSSSVNLALNAVFTGTGEDVSAYSNIKITVFSSVASNVDGLQIQQSSNNVDWDASDAYTIPATTNRSFSVPVNLRFFRIVYTNGATATTSFRLQVIFNNQDKQPSSVRPQDARSNDNDFVETLGFMMGYNSTANAWNRVGVTSGNLGGNETLLDRLKVNASLRMIDASLPVGSQLVGATGTQSLGLTVNTVDRPTRQLGIVSLASPSITYSAVANSIVPTTAATDLVTIYGSATKTINILNVWVTGVQTTAGQAQVLLIKRSTVNTAGTSTAPAKIPYDSNDAAATATFLAYTANPTLGTAIGNIRGDRAFLPGLATATDAQGLYWSFINGKSMILRGVNQGVCINLNGATLAGGSINVTIEWTEI